VAAGVTGALPRKLTAGDIEFKRLAGLIRVIVDHADITRLCTSYDLDAGEVTVHVHDRDGLLVRAGLHPDHVLKATVRGTVEVSWK
jgi:hypothetical protein